MHISITLFKTDSKITNFNMHFKICNEIAFSLKINHKTITKQRLR